MGNAGRVLMIPKGDYNPATPYEMLDCVYYNGRSYVCKQRSTGNLPTNTTYWQPMTPDSNAEIQALTNYTADTGVKNLHDVSGSEISGVYGVTVTRLSKGYKLESTMTGSWLHAYFSQKLEKNTDYVLTTDITYSSGLGAIYIYGKVTGGSNVEIKHIDGINASGGKTIEFNSGNYDEYQIYLSITGTPSTTGDITFDNFMVRDASITDPTYQPYAKTNVELTADVAAIPTNYTNAGLVTNSNPTVTVPKTARELSLMVYLNGSYSANGIINIPTTMLTSNAKTFYTGAYFSDTDSASASVIAKVVTGGAFEVSFDKLYINGASVDLPTKCNVFYK